MRRLQHVGGGMDGPNRPGPTLVANRSEVSLLRWVGGRVRVAVFAYLMPDRAIPSMKYRWPNRNRMMSGTMVKVAAAISWL